MYTILKIISLLFCIKRARPYLDYNDVIYYPHHLELIDASECVQKHFTERLHCLNNLSYGD